MKKIFGLIILLGIAANVCASEYSQPRFKGGYPIPNLNLIGCTPAYAESASATLIVAGKGLLCGMAVYGGTQGKYSVAFDAAAVGTLDEHSRTGLLVPAVVVGGDHTENSAYALSIFAPPFPVQYSSGIVVDANDSGHVTVVWYKKDATNP